MISRYAYHGLTWIDLTAPTREELLHISEEFGLSKQVEEEVFSPTILSNTTLTDTALFLTLSCPLVNGNGTSVTAHHLTSIVGKKYLITSHQEKLPVIDTFSSLFETVEKLDHHKKLTDGAMLFSELMMHLYTTIERDLQHISGRIQTIEHSLYTTSQERLIKGILQTNHTILTFKRALASQAGVLETYTISSSQFFGTEYLPYAQIISAQYGTACKAVEAQHAVLQSLQKTLDSLISIKTRSHLKTLIILSSIAIIISIISLLI